MLFTKRNLARCAIGPRMLYEFFVGLFIAMRLLWVLLLAVEQCHIPWSVPSTLFWSLYYCNDPDKQVLVLRYGSQNGGFETARRPRTKDVYPSWTPDLVKQHRWLQTITSACRQHLLYRHSLPITRLSWPCNFCSSSCKQSLAGIN